MTGSSFCYCRDNGNQTKTQRWSEESKYNFKDENGETKTWSGNGKIPLALQKQLNEGCPTETFLIEKPSQHEQSE